MKKERYIDWVQNKLVEKKIVKVNKHIQIQDT